MSDQLAKLFVVIGAKTDDFQRDIGKVEKAVAKTAQAFTPLGIAAAAVAGAGMMAWKNWAQESEDITNLAAKTGLSTDAIQEFKYAADRTGASIDDLDVAVKRMQVSLYGSGESADAARKKMEQLKKEGKEDTDEFKQLKAEIDGGTTAFAKLGLSLDDIRKMDTATQLKTILIALASIKDPAEKTALAIQIFGRSGTNILPMANDLQALIDHFIKLGIRMDKDVLEKGGKAQSALEDLGKVVNAAGEKIATALSPQLTAMAENLTKIVIKLGEWVKDNPNVVTAIGKLAVDIAILVGVLNLMRDTLIIIQAVSGPKGWATLAAGALVAAGTIAGMNALLDQTISKWNTLSGMSFTAGGTFGEGTPGWGVKSWTAPKLYASGGDIVEPTVLFGLKSQRPYAIAGEAGPEHVGPAGAGVNIIVEQLIVREQADVGRVAKELYRLQVLKK